MTPAKLKQMVEEADKGRGAASGRDAGGFTPARYGPVAGLPAVAPGPAG